MRPQIQADAPETSRSLFVCFAVLLLCLGPVDTGHASPGDHPVSTVERVDLQRYVGVWYEIARIPNRFQDHCVEGATATYALRDDGRIEVVNRCTNKDGDVDEAKGVAKVEDRDTKARLKVSFVSFLGWRPFWGDYWILGLAEDYRYAVVGDPERKYGWILARQPQLEPADQEAVFRILEANGYDTARFEMSAPASAPKSSESSPDR